MKIRNEVRDIIRNDSLFIWLFDFEYEHDSVKCIVTYGKPGEIDTRKSAMGPWEPADKLWASPTIVPHTFSGYMGLKEWDNIFYHDSYNNGKIVINNHSGYPLTPGPKALVWDVNIEIARNPNRNYYTENYENESRVFIHTHPKPIAFHWSDAEYGGNRDYYFPAGFYAQKDENVYSHILEEYVNDIHQFYAHDKFENVFWYPSTVAMRNFMSGADGKGAQSDYLTIRNELFTKLNYKDINHYALATKIVAETWVLMCPNEGDSNKPYFAIDVDFQVNAADGETKTFSKNYYGTTYSASGYGTNYYNELSITYCQMEGDAYED